MLYFIWKFVIFNTSLNKLTLRKFPEWSQCIYESLWSRFQIFKWCEYLTTVINWYNFNWSFRQCMRIKIKFSCTRQECFIRMWYLDEFSNILEITKTRELLQFNEIFSKCKIISIICFIFKHKIYAYFSFHASLTMKVVTNSKPFKTMM